MKFIHSSDLQIGKAFGYFEPEVASSLQDARQAVVRTIGEAAVKSGATAVLISGDIYEKQQMSQQTLARAIENMRSFKSVQWHLMPGNHDHFRENGLWDRLVRMQLPSNVTLHTQPGAVQIADDGGVPVFLLPAPLRFTASADDLTAYMDKEVTPEGAIRIGMAHGSIQGFGSEGEASNYVAPSRADSAGLSYLAMGDWHRQMRVNDRCWYSGTPEPDQFKLPPNAVTSHCNGGSALLVEINGSKTLPVVSPFPTGRYQWHRFEKILTEDAQIDLLENELRGLDQDLSKLVVDLRVTGAVSLSGRRAFEERILQSVGAALRGLRFDEAGLVLNPTDQDLDEIDHAGFVRVAADRLKVLAADMSNQAQALIAALALKRLYIEHLRQGARS
ncbi:metallophosphoesterase family protein [Bradyrhizobium sp. AZCC 2289]|uniref:metallophosphoesterase family protein n=1 Tax=Bradyrhizobium sp. AZCC 2289 TaxID=3117026 RepID=UPI002FEF030F